MNSTARDAYYRPIGDYINLPPFKTFNGASSYYGTAFHELGHWTRRGRKTELRGKATGISAKRETESRTAPIG
jgi:putative DNA primase/helicase